MEEAILFERSLDDVKGMISHAKLIESNLLPLSQIVRQEQMSQQVVSIEVLKYTEMMVSAQVHCIHCYVVTFVG